MAKNVQFELNATDMAMCLGVTRQTMYRYIKAGCDWHTIEGRQGKFFDLAKTVQWYINYQIDLKDERIIELEEQIEEYEDAEHQDGYKDFRAQREKASAQIEEIKLNALRKKYIEAEDINRDFRELGNLFRLSIERLKNKNKKKKVVVAVLGELSRLYLGEVQKYINSIMSRPAEPTLFDKTGATCMETTKAGNPCTKKPWKDGICYQHHPENRKGNQ